MLKPECAFCELKPSDTRLITFGGSIVSFLANPRLVPGHSLVIPRRHVIRPDELSDNEVLAIYNETRRLSSRMLGAIATGIDTWQKLRPKVTEGIGTKMDHIHFHVLPSNPGEELYDNALRWSGDAHQPLPDDERSFMTELLQDNER